MNHYKAQACHKRLQESAQVNHHLHFRFVSSGVDYYLFKKDVFNFFQKLIKNDFYLWSITIKKGRYLFLFSIVY